MFKRASLFIDKKRILLLLITLIFFSICIILNCYINIDYFLILLFIIFMIILFKKNSMIFIKYFFSFFYSAFMLLGVFLCNNTNIMLIELNQTSHHNGSLLYALIYVIFMSISIIVFDKYYSNTIKYKISSKNIFKNKIIEYLILGFIFLIGLVLFIYVIEKPSFLLKVDRFQYSNLYLPNWIKKIQYYYIYFVPVIIMPLICTKQKIDFRFILKIMITLLPYICYCFWTGNKFGIFLNLIILILSPIIVYIYKNGIKYNKNDSICVQSKKIVEKNKVTTKIFVFLIIFFVLILLLYYIMRGNNIIDSLVQRSAQQGQLWWKTYEIEKDNKANFKELSDELEPIKKTIMGEKIDYNYGVYKIMYLVAPKMLVERKIASGSRYSAQGIEIAFYYFGYLGIFIHAILRGIIEVILVNLLIKYIFSGKIIETVVISKLIINAHLIFTQGDIYSLFSKASILSIIIFIIIVIISKKINIEDKLYKTIQGFKNQKKIEV